MEDEFFVLARNSRNRLREEYWKSLRQFERDADEDPAEMARLVSLAVDQKNLSCQRDLLDRFGTRVWIEEGGGACIAEPARIPKDLLQFHHTLVLASNTSPGADGADATIEALGKKFPQPWRGKRRAWAAKFTKASVDAVYFITVADQINEAARKAERTGKDPDRAVCNVFLIASRCRPTLYPSLFLGQGRPPEVAVALLTGWVASQVSLSINKRLRAALDTDTHSPSEALLRELPAAVLAEWRDGGGPEGLWSLRNRAAIHLERAGDQTKVLSKKGKLEESPETVPAADPDLEDFELRETMRQQRRQLDSLEQAAGLAPQEMEVWQRVRQGKEAARIAAELEITKNNVYVTKKHAFEKLEQARKAAGF